MTIKPTPSDQFEPELVINMALVREEEPYEERDIDFLVAALPGLTTGPSLWEQMKAAGMVTLMPEIEPSADPEYDAPLKPLKQPKPPKAPKSLEPHKKRRGTPRRKYEVFEPTATSELPRTRVTEKTCVKCNQTKPIDQFGTHYNSRDGHQSYCKSCKNALGKQRRENNPAARLKHHIATRVMKQCPDYPANLVQNLEQYLGYTMEYLVDYLERDCQKRLGMRLIECFRANFHLDHKYPLSKYPVKEVGDQAFRDCWRPENLWMIAAEANLKKGARIIDLEAADDAAES